MTTDSVCTREEFQDALGSATMCGAQHDGWSCNSCFHTIIEEDYGHILSVFSPKHPQ